MAGYKKKNKLEMFHESENMEIVFALKMNQRN